MRALYVINLGIDLGLILKNSLILLISIEKKNKKRFEKWVEKVKP